MYRTILSTFIQVVAREASKVISMGDVDTTPSLIAGLLSIIHTLIADFILSHIAQTI